MKYKVKLDIFEGPMDLLLHLIKRSEVDIYDIPIAEITEQYLEYIEVLESLNLDMAGEFLLMAATLTHIKSRMLLPLPETEEEDEEGMDPREELIRRLLEYQRYKEAAEELVARNILGRDVFSRGGIFELEETATEGGEEEPLEAALVGLSLFDLVDALKEVLKKAPKDYTIDMTGESFKVVDKINYIMEMLDETRSATFASLFPTGAPRVEIIVTFLALLELARLLMVRIHQGPEGMLRLYLPQHAAGGTEGATGGGQTSHENYEGGGTDG